MPLLWLIGMMGSGKSRVGSLVAGTLGWTFVDTDAEVERRTGRSIAEFWVQRGEPAFRAREAEVIGEIAGRREGAVVAAGGGAVLAPDNVAAMRGSGLVIWLAGQPSELAARLAGDLTRPLLASADRQERLAELLSGRDPAYRQAAHHVVDTSGKAPEQVAAEVVALWNGS